jgi:hypothetical protein
MSFRSREGAARFQERRQRENDAPRLTAEVPRLETLRLEVEESRGAAAMPETKHVRHVVVAHAPALFLLPCGDTSCRDGGHDLTRAILAHLAHGKTEFTVEETCSGTIGTASCGRAIHVRARATYK